MVSPKLDRSALAVACESLEIDKLSDQDYDFLTEYVSIIKPIANAITFLEGDIQTFGAYLPMLFGVRQTLKDLYLNGNFEYCAPLLIAVRDGFDKRFGHLMKLNGLYEQGNSKAIPLFLAMVANPQYKLNFIPNDWFDSNANGMSQIKGLLLNAMKQSLRDEQQQNMEQLKEAQADENVNGQRQKGRTMII